MSEYETILVEQRGRVGWITLNRPEALNALNSRLAEEVTAAAVAFDQDEGVGAIVVTGSEKAFAAGADIKEMEGMSAGTAVLLGGAVALFSAVAAVAARRSDPGWRWFRSWQIPAAVGAAILAVLGPQLPLGVVLGSVAVVFLVVAAQADRRRRG